MTARNRCLEEIDLVDYLYDDDNPDRDALAAHVAACASCAEEVRDLQAARRELQAWAPPDTALGFRLVAATPAATFVPAGRWWQHPLPAWAQVAAAVLLFGAGAALGALRGTTMGAASGGEGAVPPVTAAAVAAPVSARDLTALEERLRAEMTQRLSAPAPTAASGQGDEALLAQVRTLIRESERRQQQELTLRAAELVKDVDAQRRGDLARIERTFGQMEGTTGVQVEQQRQLLNYLMRVSQRPSQ